MPNVKHPEILLVGIEFRSRKLRGTAAVALALLLPSIPAGNAAPTTRAEAWFARFSESDTACFRIKFKRQLPILFSTNSIRVTIDGKSAMVSLTPVDWFTGSWGKTAYLVCNSLSPDAEVAAEQLPFRAFRWVVGCDATNYWFVNEGANLSLCSATEPTPLKPQGQPERFLGPAPRSFGLSLSSVVAEVLHLGIPAARTSAFTMRGHEFSTESDTGERISGYVSPGDTQNRETLFYTVQPSGEQVKVELSYDATLAIPEFPTMIERIALRKGQQTVQVRFDILELHPIDGRRVARAAALPSPEQYMAKGTAILYSNGIGVDLKSRTMLSVGYAAATRGHRRITILAILCIFLALPIANGIWQYARRQRWN